MSGVLDLGVDVVEVARMRAFAARHPERLGELFTARELAYCRGRRGAAESLAARFAAKEAAFKALGTLSGFTADWRSVELASEREGKPRLHLRGGALRAARARGARRALVSVAHSRSVAIAAVVLLGAEGRP
jgi:holo-[acyl-carrier protein] synthase